MMKPVLHTAGRAMLAPSFRFLTCLPHQRAHGGEK
jgi:hypothetical protein